jgi:hypothetical protein
MIRQAAFVFCMASLAAHAQQISFDTLYSRDSDDTRVSAQSLTGWRFAPAVVGTQLLSWYTTSDIDVRNSGHGQVRLGFQTQAPAAAAATLPRLDFRGSAIKLSVRAARWDDVAQFVLIFGSDGVSATQTITLDLKRKLVSPPDGVWIDLVVPVSEFEKYNAIDLSNVNFAMVRAQGRGGSHVDVSTVSLVASGDGNAAAHERRILDPQFDITDSTVRNAADDAVQFNYGAKATALQVRNDAGVSRHATDARLLGSVELGQLSAAGSIGVLDAQTDTTVGSAEIAWRVADSFVLSLAHARNAVDTVEALQADVVQDATTLAADYSTARWGVYAGVADVDYTDGNDRSMLNSKLHFGIWDKIGASAYVRSLHYHNTDPYTGFYFSPEKYDRWLVGVAARARLSKSLVVSGHLDGGRQTTDGDDSPGWTTRLMLESKPTKNWSYKLTAGVDQTRPDYRYRYVMGYLAYE